jgi:hypothetical protein
MRDDDRGEPAVSGRERPGATTPRSGASASAQVAGAGWVLETIVSPFHCLYGDALELHNESRLRMARSEADASRLARAAVLLYLAAAEALIHQAAVELGRGDLAHLAYDSHRPQPLLDACRLLPLLMGEAARGAFDADSPPWPQFAELVALRDSWTYPGPAADRRAYYFRPENRPDVFEPLDPHEVPAGHEATISVDRLAFPLTGLPRDPYALRPQHLDTARGVLDAMIDAVDRRVGGALTQGRRHRSEPVRVLSQPTGEGEE